MSVQLMEALQQHLRRLCEEAVLPEDSVLLKRFVADNDRDAYELLIARHGPMVLGTARRLVENAHDAEDVFQAVFLSLARLAKTIREGRALPAWLHKATCRIAAKVRNNRGVRTKESLPEPCENSDPGAEMAWREVRRALDEEFQRLPERLRSPLLLCYLSGLTRDEAAKQLGWSLNTLKRRLEEGRNVLRTRLERRGIAAVGLALAVLDPKILQAALSLSHVEATVNLIFLKGAVVPSKISVLLLGLSTGLKGIVTKTILALLATVAVGVGIYAAKLQDDAAANQVESKESEKLPEEKKNQWFDDPLPAGSTLRLGTSRFRHGTPISNLAVSPDGKFAVASSSGQGCRVFDFAAGRERYSLIPGNHSYHIAPAAMSHDRKRMLFDLIPNDIEAVAISPDGKTIAAKEYDNHGLFLQIYDSASGRDLRKIGVPLQSATMATNKWLAYTPDGKNIAVTSEGNVIYLIDLQSGKKIQDFIVFGGKDMPMVYAVAFSPDGKLMAADNRIWDVSAGKEIRRLTQTASGENSALAFSPDGKMLAGGGLGGRLHLWDVDSGTERKAFPKDGNELRSIAFSPDGKWVAAGADSIRVYDSHTGGLWLHIDQSAKCLQFTDDGKTLTGAVASAICRWDVITGKLLTPATSGDSSVQQILVTPDGKRIITGGLYWDAPFWGRVATEGLFGNAHIWDGDDGTHRKSFKISSRLAISPDGRFVACLVEDQRVTFTEPGPAQSKKRGSRIRLYDIGADKWLDRFPPFKGGAGELAFSNDGKNIVTFDPVDGMVRWWDFDSGTEEHVFPTVPGAELNQRFYERRSMALSPDGKTLAVAYDVPGYRRLEPTVNDLDVVRLWDVATGKELHELKGHIRNILGMAFSPDGRFLVTAGDKATEFSRGGELIHSLDQVFVWETATGKRVAALPDGLPIGACAVAFSHDGRFLATALADGSIRIWETASWTVWNEYKASHRDRPTALTFGPKGRLYSGSLDTTVLAWDTWPPRDAAGSLQTAWTDFAKPASGGAYKAEGRFLATPAESVKFFAERIKPAEDNAKRIRQLIADLDSAKFTARENASKSLRDFGEEAKPYLEETIKTSKSAEVVDRARKILEEPKRTTPEQLRQIRVVLLLEFINDDDSKNLLKKWAGGFKTALLTEQAKAALKRLEGAASTKRGS